MFVDHLGLDGPPGAQDTDDTTASALRASAHSSLNRVCEASGFTGLTHLAAMRAEAERVGPIAVAWLPGADPGCSDPGPQELEDEKQWAGRSRETWPTGPQLLEGATAHPGERPP